MTSEFRGKLSAREAEVLALIAVGRTNNQIADLLFISPATVARHVSGIFAKTGAANRTEAASLGARQQVLPVVANALPSPPRPPFPPELDRWVQLTFVGRIAALDGLRKNASSSAQGERSVTLISGEPGIGKTRLAAEFAVQEYTNGSTVLFGRCDEDGGTSFQPFVEALRYYAARAPEARLREQLGRSAPDLARLIPEIRERLRDVPESAALEPAAERYRLFDGVASFLEVISNTGTGPLLVVLDDIHWADKATLLALRHIARRRIPARLTIIGTYRDTELGRSHPLTDILADLRREPCHDRLLLRGLDSGEVGLLLDSIPMDGAAGFQRHSFQEALIEQTEGNPFFVHEIIRHLREAGRMGPEMPAKAFVEGDIPEGVREVIGRRLSRLSEPCNASLTCAAVIGLEFELEVLGRAGGTAEDALIGQLEEATASGIVEEVVGEPDHYRFSHALIRQTLYGEISTSRKVRLHHSVAQAIQAGVMNRGTDHLPDLAHHFLEASTVADADTVVGYAVAAALQAFEHAAYENAAEYYRRALEVLSSTGAVTAATACELELARGEALLRAGDHAGTEAFANAAARAREMNDPLAFGKAVLGGLKFRGSTGVRDLGLETLVDEALEMLGEANLELRSALIARMAEATLTISVEAACALADEAVRVATASGDARARLGCMYGHLLVSELPNRLELRLEESAELTSLASEVGQIEQGLLGRRYRIGALLELGENEAADAEIAEYGSIAAGARLAHYEWFYPLYRGVRAHMAGRLADATELCELALSLGTQAEDPSARLYSRLLTLGCLDESEGLAPLTAEFELRLPQLRDSQSPWLGTQSARLTYIYLRCGKSAEARALFEETMSSPQFGPALQWQWLDSAARLAICCFQFGDRAAAQKISETLAPFAAQHVVSRVGYLSLGSVSRYLGILSATMERWDEAEQQFAAALAMNERAGARLWVAHTNCDLAGMLVARERPGDLHEARRLATEVLKEAEQMGTTLLIGRSKDLLRSV